MRYLPLLLLASTNPQLASAAVTGKATTTSTATARPANKPKAAAATAAAGKRASGATPVLPSPLEDFLGPPPARFDQRFLKPARDLKAADELAAAKNLAGAIGKLTPLANSEMGEHVAFELATLYREKKDFAKSTAQAERLVRNYPNTVYADRAKEILDGNECDQALVTKGDEGTHMLERCLWRASWHAWGGELEPQATALYDRLRAAKDPLLDAFVAEALQALPSGNSLRARITKEIPDEKLEQLSTLARFHTKNERASGVKAVNPDADLFDSGIKAVLKENWKEANEIFKRFPAEFPQSEHWDRAQYWIARTEAKLGHDDAARKQYEGILSDNPLTYYGLQAAFYLKHDWTPQISSIVPAAPAVKWTGALTTRQALSLWRLRALLLTGLVDYAREEAKTLANARANGAAIGQEDPKGALALARLFSDSGNHMAAFAQAYSALSLDPTLLNRSSISLIFPEPFLDQFEDAAERTGVNSLLLLSVAKQESAFLPNAVSKADAYGLLQLLPATAREVQPGMSRLQLFDPAANAVAGGLYLYKLLDRYQGNIPLALAAYNAGPNRVSQWMKDIGDTPLMRDGFDADAFIDSIPFTETRRYVGNIMRNYAWYRMLANDGQVTSVQELMFQWQKTDKKPELPADAPAESPAPAAAQTR
jgi:soluble lytic murein transglycosylase-like protein